ncbi:hypothetical protein D3C72_2060560 [compost metagenome]
MLEKLGLVNDPKIRTRYEEIERSSLLYSNAMIKYSLNNDKRLIERILQGIESFSNNELELINELLYQINNNETKDEIYVLGNANSNAKKWMLG